VFLVADLRDALSVFRLYSVDCSGINTNMEHLWNIIERGTPNFSTASNIDLPGIEHGRPQCEAGDRSSGAL
jgi:hypothetical protein